MEKIINPHLGTIIIGKIEGPMIFTENYITLCKYRIRGTLNAALRPVLLSNIKSYNINPDMVESLTRGLIASEDLNGTIEGKGSSITYVPKIYTISRKNWARNFFTQNGFMDYEMLAKAQISNPAAFMQSEFPKEGIALSNSFVSNKIEVTIHELIERFIKKDNGWVDTTSYFDIPLAVEDQIEIVRRSSALNDVTSKKENKMLFIDHYLISNGFIRECLQKYENYIKSNPSAAIIPTSSEPTEDSKPTKQTSNAPTNASKKGGKKTQTNTTQSKKKNNGIF
jgi:hypothetical protein